MSRVELSRRAFLRDAALTAAGVAVVVHVPGCAHMGPQGGPNDFTPNAMLRVTTDNKVIFTLARVEMGQGTLTSETMMVAEELNLDPAEIEVELAPAHSAYNNPDFPVQITGGSNSTKSSFEPLRKAGAMVRESLIAAAAAEWGLPKRELSLQGKKVVHTKSGKSADIGSLAIRAKDFIDGSAEPKPRAEWKVIGKSRTRLDAPAKVDGSAKFGADYSPEGVEVAVVIRGPFGATLERFDASAAEKMPGVRAIFAIPSGVAVVADRYPRARKAAQAVQVSWSASDFNTDAMWKAYAQALDEDAGDKARNDGDAEEVIEQSKEVISAEYSCPWLAHAAMEPMNATAWVQEERTDIWTPTQAPSASANAAARITGHSFEDIHLHQTLLGGAFGRKAMPDAVVEAVHISKVRKAPVRVQWSREDDMQHDWYRPASLHRLQGVVRDGQPVAWAHRIIAQSAILDQVPFMLQEAVPGFMSGPALWVMKTFVDDPSIVEGAKQLPYAIPNVKVSYHSAKGPVLGGAWRSVGHSHNGFVVESFVDELAHAAGADPVEFRRKLLKDAPIRLRTLNLAVEKAGWGKPLPPGRARGVAVHESFFSTVAQVAEVSVEEGRIRVHKVVAAVDCGTAVNPDGVRSQIEGGIVYGLSAALKQEAITFAGGQAQQSNFHDFEVLRMHECPEIEVHIVESDAPPTGVGEPGLPPIAAAVGNAVFALTKKRLRSLPLKLA